MRTCARCGVSIEHRDRRSRHCSPRCRDRDYEGSAKGTKRNCLQCGSEFTASKNPHVYCSRPCASRADLEKNRSAYNRRNSERRARERGARTEETFTHEEIFARDGWICQLCITPIGVEYTGRHPLAPALDHIVPLNKGGKHERSNVQAAHFSCNARKQDRLVEVVGCPEMS